jgi:hypothetical protein
MSCSTVPWRSKMMSIIAAKYSSRSRMVTGAGVDSMRWVKPRMSANRTVADRQTPEVASRVPSARADSASRGEA